MIPYDYSDLVHRLEVFAHEKRLRLIHQLLRRMFITPSIAARHMDDMPERLAGHHLKIIADSGLAVRDTSGAHVIYTIDKERVSKTIQDLIQFLEGASNESQRLSSSSSEDSPLRPSGDRENGPDRDGGGDTSAL